MGLHSDIQQEDPKIVVDFIETDFTPLKSSLMEHCQEWQRKLTDLLQMKARNETNEILDYFDSHTKTFFSPIKDLDELKYRIQLLDESRKDDQEMESKIAPIEAKYAKLAEFEVIPPTDELDKKAQMRPAM